jgi:hypothetical protein
MKVHSVRLNAFATNSSSVHTPVILNNKAPESYGDCLWEFGNHFFIKTEDEKRRYMACLLDNCLRRLGLLPNMRKPIVEKWVGISIDDREYYLEDNEGDCSNPMSSQFQYDKDGPSDLPCDFGTNFPSKAFFQDLLDWTLNSKIGVVGWYDNDYYPESDGYKDTKWPHKELTSYNDKWTCRKDSKGFWVLFNNTNGTKLRVSFDDKADTSKSSAPELVDLKITNWCDKGCHYCYQNSTTKGKHTDSWKIWGILAALRKLQVFEVAIGGGEPTAHPYFWSSILRDCKNNSIKANFSTRNLSWLSDKNKVKIFKDCCGAFAYSIDSKGDIENLAKALIINNLENGYDHNWATVQYVMQGHETTDDLVEIASEASKWDIPLTLLGFKNIGRAKGSLIKKNIDLKWKKVFNTWCKISVDTCLAEMYAEDFKKAGIKDWSIQIKEGAHSMYIDAVDGKMGKSSYCSNMEKLDVDKIEEAFRNY